MKWSRRFLLLSVVLLLSLSALSAEVCFSDEEYSIMQAEDEELGQILTTQESINKTQAMELTQLGRESRIVRSNLSRAQGELIDSQMEIEQAETSLDEAVKSWREEKTVIIIVTVLIDIAVAILAFVFGNLTG